MKESNDHALYNKKGFDFRSKSFDYEQHNLPKKALLEV